MDRYVGLSHSIYWNWLGQRVRGSKDTQLSQNQAAQNFPKETLKFWTSQGKLPDFCSPSLFSMHNFPNVDLNILKPALKWWLRSLKTNKICSAQFLFAIDCFMLPFLLSLYPLISSRAMTQSTVLRRKFS